MTIDDVKSILPLDSMGDVFMDKYNCSITVDNFVSKFGDSQITCDSLSLNQNATVSWKDQFQAWKNEGVIT